MYDTPHEAADRLHQPADGSRGSAPGHKFGCGAAAPAAPELGRPGRRGGAAAAAGGRSVRRRPAGPAAGGASRQGALGARRGDWAEGLLAHELPLPRPPRPGPALELRPRAARPTPSHRRHRGGSTSPAQSSVGSRSSPPSCARAARTSRAPRRWRRRRWRQPSWACGRCPWRRCRSPGRGRPRHWNCWRCSAPRASGAGSAPGPRRPAPVENAAFRITLQLFLGGLEPSKSADG